MSNWKATSEEKLRELRATTKHVEDCGEESRHCPACIIKAQLKRRRKARRKWK